LLPHDCSSAESVPEGFTAELDALYALPSRQREGIGTRLDKRAGQASHEVVFQILGPIVLQLHEVTREVIEIRRQLRELGHEIE